MAKSLAVSITQNSQSTANNTSSITVKGTCTCSGESYRGSSRTGTYTIKVAYSDGTSTKTYYSSQSFTSGAAANSTTTLFSVTLTVAHDSVGYASVTASVVYDSSSWNLTASATKQLTTIARASTITSASAVTLGNSTSIVFTPKSTSFYYKLKFTVGSHSATVSVGKPGKTSAYTYTYSMTIATWAPYITTSTSATCTVVLYTYSDSGYSTQIGSSSSKTFTVTVPTSVVPTCSASVSEGNSAIGLGIYLTGQSKLKVAVTATMAYSSAIASISVKVGSTTYTASVTTTSSGATGTITSGTLSATSVTITVTVKDKRGRSGTCTKTVSLVSYSVPTIEIATIERCLSSGTVDETNGAYVKVTYQYTVSEVTNNTSAMTLQWKEQSATSYSDTLISESGVFTGTETVYVSEEEFSTEKAFTFLMTVADAVTSVTKTINVSTALVIMDIFEDGTGVAFGKVAETAELFECNWKMQCSENITIDKSSTTANAQMHVIGDTVDGCLHSDSGGLFGLYNSTKSKRLVYHNADTVACLGNSTYASYIYGSSVRVKSNTLYIDNTTGSGWTGVRCIGYDTSYAITLEVGSGGVNRGIYDETAGSWVIYRSSTDGTTVIPGATTFNSTITVTSKATVKGILDVPSRGVAIANNYGVYHYLASGSSYVKCEYLNTSNQLCLGNSSYVTILYGSSVYLKGTSTAVTSDRRLKSEIAELTDKHDAFFDRLTARTFRLNSYPEKLHTGFVVQEVEDAMESAGLEPEDYGLTSWYKADEDDKEYGAIAQEELIALLVYEVQNLKKRVAQL